MNVGGKRSAGDDVVKLLYLLSCMCAARAEAYTRDTTYVPRESRVSGEYRINARSTGKYNGKATTTSSSSSLFLLPSFFSLVVNHVWVFRLFFFFLRLLLLSLCGPQCFDFRRTRPLIVTHRAGICNTL